MNRQEFKLVQEKQSLGNIGLAVAGMLVAGLLTAFAIQLAAEHEQDRLARRAGGESDYERFHPQS